MAVHVRGECTYGISFRKRKKETTKNISVYYMLWRDEIYFNEKWMIVINRIDLSDVSFHLTFFYYYENQWFLRKFYRIYLYITLLIPKRKSKSILGVGVLVSNCISPTFCFYVKI